MLVFLTDPRRKYHVKLLAFSAHGDGYQAHQTVSTSGCPCKCTLKTHDVHCLEFTITQDHAQNVL